MNKEILDWFEGNELAANVWYDKYAIKNVERTPEDTIIRLTDEFHRIEQKYPNPLTYREIYDLLKGFKKVIPAGSPIFGIGNKTAITSLSNCYVVDSPVDSYGGIMKTDQELAQLMKRRGGVGVDISTLRPAGSRVSNSAGSSTGAVSFMSRFSNTTREVAQEGRRGALIITIDISHPDSQKFILAKDDLTQITGANISVKITDEFMQAVLENGAYEIYHNRQKGEKPVFINAREVFKTLVHQAWKTAEPGVLFWDRIIKESPADCYDEFKTISTNPCQPSNATVLTPRGISTIGKIKVGDRIWSKEGWTRVIRKIDQGYKDVYKYSTTFGHILCTENHNVIDNGVKVPANKAKTLELLRGINTNLTCQHIENDAVMAGLLIGDGSIHKASNNLIYLCIGENDQDYFKSEISDLIGRHRPGIKSYAYEVTTTLSSDHLKPVHLRDIPKYWFEIDSKIKLACFLRGLYSANGSVVADRITLKAASKILIEQTQVLLNSLNIASYITVNKSKRVMFSNGEYECKTSYDLNITRDKDKFYTYIGFIQKYKMEKLSKIISKKTKKVEKLAKDIISSEFVENRKVWDITVDNNSHTYWSNGFNIANCGELPLCAYDSCRLMHVNVYEYVVNPFTKDAYFDIDSYKEDVYKAQRLMDDMIDLEAEKLERIIDKIRRDPEDLKIKEVELNLWLNIRRKLVLGRRTGLNPLLGLADALAALGYKYDSDEAISVAEMMAAAGATSAYMSSIHMAMERGSFAVWDIKTEKDNPFLNRILDCLDGNTVAIYKSFGRRNIACLTIPPSGTISIISQVSSGIEPVFNLSYTRKRKVSAEHPNKSFQDKNGDWWEEYEVYHPKLLKWMKTVEEGKHDGVHNPYRGSTTNEIDPLQKVRMQGVIQQWIDHSISITHNLPENIKEDDVFNIYVEAWRNGCKGCTIYREGSRDGILTNKKKIIFEQHDAPKRPKELICNVHTTKVRGEEFIVIVGLLEDKPYEVFVMRPNGVNPMPKKHKVIKLSKGNYILTTLDWNNKDQGYNFGPIVESLNDEERLITRLISTSLRHGSNINFVVEQLDKSEGNITSFGKAISRVLKKYTSTETKEKCDNCGGNLINEGGCYICPSCGNSKCS